MLRRAQTFTALTTGSLVRGEVETTKPAMSTGDYLMQIVTTDDSGTPTNTVLASTTIPNSSVPDGPSRVAATFDPPASVVAGQQYAFVFSRSGSTWTHRYRADNPCPGRQFNSPAGSNPWNPDFPAADMVFAVFVEPPPAPEPEPQPIAGRSVTLDANNNKVKKGKNVRLRGRVAETRQGACAANQPIELQRKKPSQSTFTTVEQLTTDAAGSFSAREKVKKTFEYRAQAAETSTCGGGVSNTEKVRVKKPK
jgi:hypothetical protein